MPTQLGLGTCKALAARVDPGGGSACVRLIHDEIGKIEFKGGDFPIDRSGESLDTQATLVTVGILRVQDGGVHVRAEIDGGRLESVAILSEENPALRAVRSAPDPQRRTEVAAQAQMVLSLAEIVGIGRVDRIRMRRHLVLVSVVEPQAPENCDSVVRFPVELRVQSTELATVIEPVDLVDMPGGARGWCHAAIQQRHIPKIPTLLGSSAREPIEAR